MFFPHLFQTATFRRALEESESVCGPLHGRYDHRWPEAVLYAVWGSHGCFHPQAIPGFCFCHICGWSGTVVTARAVLHAALVAPSPDLCLCCRLLNLSAERTSSSRVSAFTSRTLNPNTGIGSMIVRHDLGMVLELLVAAVVGWEAAATVVWLILVPSVWTLPWWLLLRLLCRVVGGWWECWLVSRPPLQGVPPVERALVGTRVSHLVQETAITAPAQPASAGEQGQILRPVVVGLALVLGPVWSQNPLGGVCKLNVCMVSIVKKISPFTIDFWCWCVSENFNFLGKRFVHFREEKKKKLRI